MHIDHSKLVELLTEATGLKKENVEKQLLDLVDEIKAAISDGDAYEVDGFGVFSGIGNNIIFIPADDLATEINYKYAGMEPLIMDEATDDEAPADTHEEETTLDDEDDPFAGLMDKEDEPEEKKSSFELDVADEEDGAGFDEPETEDVDEFADETADEAPFDIAEENLEDDTEEEITPDLDSEEKPGPEKWGIDTYKDDSAEGMFSGLLGDKGKDQPEEDQSTDEDEGQEDDFSSLFDEMEDEPADDSDLAAELSKQLSDDPSLEDEPDDDLLGSFLNDDESEGEEEEQEEEALSAESESEPDEVFSSEEDSKEEEADTEPEESFTSEIEDPETKADSEDNEDIDFDDPFETLAEEDEEENEEDDESFDVEETSDDHEEPVPVITNLASEGAKKESKEKKDLRPEEPAKRNVAEQKTQNQPVLLWVLLIIIGLSAGIYGLGYFGVVYIPGVTTQPQVASVSEPTPPPPEQSENDPEEPATQETSPNQVPAANEPEEQPNQSTVSQEETAPAGQSRYGMRGVPVAAANDGYTIVVYSLSNEANARTKQRELANAGYRALMTAVPSQQYGTLWRISLGQFVSLREAALAAETLDRPFSENYFITQIQ